MIFCGMNWTVSAVFLPEVTAEPSDASSPLASDASASASQIPPRKGKKECGVHRSLAMTPDVSALLFALLVFRRSTQQRGAAVSHDEAGDPPGDDGQEPS